MKLDKEILMKQHFWFLLGPFVLLVLVSLILLWTSTASAIEEKEKKLKDAEKALQGVKASETRNRQWLDQLEIRDKEADKQRTKIWEQSWKSQEGFMTWPDNPQFDPVRTKYFGDDIDPSICAAFLATDDYQQEMDGLARIVQPVDSKGEGVVQFGANGSPKKVEEWVAGGTPPPMDLWLAQEDFWVQRELLKTVKEANDLVATYTQAPAAAPPDKSKGEVARQTFANSDWRLDLTLMSKEGKPRLRSQITNLGKRRQSLHILFEVRFKSSQDIQPLYLDSEPLAPDASWTKEVALIPAVGNPKEIDSVKQVFDWRTAPVKRIDTLVMGYHSARTQARGTKSPKFVAPAAGAGKPAASGATAPSGANPPPNADKKGMGSMRASGPQGGGAGGNTTANGLVLDRYSETTTEVRRMPVALVVVIDQAHIQEMLAAVANSPLRIQVTQWHWQRFHGDIKPKLDGSSSAPASSGPGRNPAPAGKGPGVGKAGGEGGRPGMVPPSSGPGQPGLNFNNFLSGKNAVARAASEEQDWDLVELAIYGIASLYERFPSKDAIAANAKAGTQQPAAKK